MKPLGRKRRLGTIGALVLVLGPFGSARGEAPPAPDQALGPLVGARADTARLQTWLTRTPYQPGSIDGSMGANTRIALRGFQQANGLPVTGTADARTLAALRVAADGDARPVLRTYTVTADDVNGPYEDLPDDIYSKHEAPCLCYESAWESIAERFHTSPGLLAALNPDVDLSTLEAGQVLVLPDPTTAAPIDTPVARIVVDVDAPTLTALDARGEVLRQYPAVVGETYAGYRGELVLTGVAHDPTYHLDPASWDEIPDALPAVTLPPGPNSPVGAVWMQLSLDGYGVHGTSSPETIGHTESHGCVRLTNWSALELAEHVRPGETQVEFVGLGRGS